MKTIRLGQSDLKSSRLAYGCWRLAETTDSRPLTPDGEEAGRLAVTTAYEAGYTLFDHADIYCDGIAEKLFGQVLKTVSGMRERVLIATKCGIRKPEGGERGAVYRYDSSAAHIISSCEGSLRRLQVDTIDIYQLHRPDYLMAPEEVADAFSRLSKAGKVRAFGLSNFRPSQVTALQSACPMPLLVNQVEISLLQLRCLEDGTLDQCLVEKITPMAWSPLGGGQLGAGAHRVLPSQRAYRPGPVIQELDGLAKVYDTTRIAIALAWLLKHPSGIIPIVGSVSPENIRRAAEAAEVELSREDWYRLLAAARGEALP